VLLWFWRLRPEKKKVPVVCLAGCAVVVLAITTGKKKVPVICLAGCQFLVLEITTGKKKVPVVCLADCAVASVFGSGDYDRKKKKFQLSVWAGCVTTGKKKVPVVARAITTGK
jgi:hypothetical protein